MDPVHATPEIYPPSPIRRLPPELLVEIFAICLFNFTPTFDEISDIFTGITFESEMKRLAHLPLLTLSPVCSRWHSLALGAPSLWGTIELDKRAGDSSLDALVADEPHELTFHPVLDILAPTSKRWRRLEFHGTLPLLQGLAEIEGRLPRLRTSTWTSVRFPRATPLYIQAASGEDLFFLMDEYADERGANASGRDLTRIFNLNLPPITAHISSLSIKFITDFRPANPEHSRQALGDIFACLTLPMLENLELRTNKFPALAISWPNTQFLGLAARSSLGTRLVILSLPLHHVLITEAELLACLRVLPAVEELQISDRQGRAQDHHLMTDELLRALTYQSDAHALVPALRIFNVRSSLRFDDSVYLAFLRSRTYLESCFESNLWWIPRYHREIDTQVVEQINQMCMRGNLLFQFLPVDPEW
ncbi:hypothetical protein C8R43DRAFT_1233738 [Mycena crocata]|nr:hypothetical protein C8R43DRAFT_1233738 [Mycena crocata]